MLHRYMQHYVYKITNLKNKKVYIGKTSNSNPINRWARHLYNARNKTTASYQYQALHKAITKYGEDNFTFEIIEQCETEDQSLLQEQFWIKQYDSFGKNGYNLTAGGEGSSGFKHSAETIQKMSAMRKGKQTGRENSFYGKTHTKQAKKIIGDKSKGRKMPLSSVESRSKMNRETVLEIRKRFEAEDYVTLKDLAKEFGITYHNLKCIVLRKTWKDI